MTYKDLLLEITAKATGKPLITCEAMLLMTETGRKIMVGPPKEITEAEATEWRVKLETNLPVVLAWLSREFMIQLPPKGSV